MAAQRRIVNAYRAYQLNSAGHIVAAEWLDADSDSEAEALARGRCGPAVPKVEVWYGARRVAVVDCPPDRTDS